MGLPFGADTSLLGSAASDLRRKTVDYAEHRAHVRWEGVSECGSGVARDVVAEFADWYLATWSGMQGDLIALADSAHAVAMQYEETDQTVTGMSGIEIF